MDDLIRFVVHEVALDGERGTPIGRIWHFVDSHRNGTPVTPPRSSGGACGESNEALMDEDFKSFFWRLLLDEGDPLEFCQVQALQKRVASKKSTSAAKKRKLAAGNASNDGTELTTSYQASPIPREELDNDSLAALLAKYGGSLRVVVPSQVRHSIILNSVDFGMSKQLFAVYEEIVRWRSVGITQSDLSKALSIDPRSVFHFIKQMAVKNLVAKFPVVHRGSYTHLTLAMIFAHMNESYLATCASRTSLTAQGHEMALNHEHDEDDEANLKQSALFFNSPEQVGKPGVFAALVRQKISQLLSSAPDRSMHAEDVINGLGLVPTKYPRQRKWFNRTIASMVQSGHIQRFTRPRPKVEPADPAAPRGPLNFLRLLKEYTLQSAQSYAPLDGGTENRAASSAAGVDDDPRGKAGTKVVESRTERTKDGIAPAESLLQDGVLSDLPFEYQIHRLLAHSKNGLTGRQLRKQLGNIGPRPFNKFIDRLLRHKSNGAGRQYMTVQRVAEYRGRERRYRYYTEDAMEDVNEQDESVKRLLDEQAKQRAFWPMVVSQTQTPRLPAAEESSVHVIDEASPATPSDPSANATSQLDQSCSVSQTPRQRKSQVGPGAAPITMPARSTVEVIRRRELLYEFLKERRIIQMDHIFMKEFQEEFYKRNPIMNGSTIDKKTVMRTLDNMETDGMVRTQWAMIPLIGGGSAKKHLLVLADTDNPVTDEEIMDTLKCMEKKEGFAAGSGTLEEPPSEGGQTEAQSAEGNEQPRLPLCIEKATPPVLQTANRWRAVAQEYGWLDARMIRAKWLYLFLYENTQNTEGHRFDVTMIFRQLTLGLYLNLVGHTSRSDNLLEYMTDHLHQPLIEVDQGIRAELLGDVRSKRRFKSHIAYMLSVLIALNLVQVPGDPLLCREVTEQYRLQNEYIVPREVQVLNYLAPRSERVPLRTRFLHNPWDAWEFWNDLQLLRVPTTVDRTSSKGGNPGDECNSSASTSKKKLNGEDSNADADPIYFIGLARNWIVSHQLTLKQRRILDAVCDEQNGRTPLHNRSACEELARRTELPLARVKQYLQRAETELKHRATLEEQRRADRGLPPLTGKSSAKRGFIYEIARQREVKRSKPSADGRKRPVQVLERDGEIEVVPEKRPRLAWTPEEDRTVLLLWVIFQHRVHASHARVITWSPSSLFFPNRAFDTTRRRAATLLRRSENLVIAKQRERSWEAHIRECPMCDVDYTDIVTCVNHLSELEYSPQTPVHMELPDTLEELMDSYTINLPTCAPVVDLVDQETTARSKLVHLYGHALFVDSDEQDPFLCCSLEPDSKMKAKEGARTRQPPDGKHYGDDLASVQGLPSFYNIQKSFDVDLQVPIVSNLIKMIYLTPEADYDSTLAFAMLHTYPADIVERAINAGRASGAIVRMRPHLNLRAVPGRNIALSDRLCGQLFGHSGQRQMGEAIRCVSEMWQQGSKGESEDEESGVFLLDDLVNEGTMMALIELLVAGYLKFEVQVSRLRIFSWQVILSRSRSFHLDVPVIARTQWRRFPNLNVSYDTLATSTSPEFVPRVDTPQGLRVRVGQPRHVLVDPFSPDEMRKYCVHKAVFEGQEQKTRKKRSGPKPIAKNLDAALENWIVPRVWNNIQGYVVPALLRSAMTAILSQLLKHSGASLAWLCERFSLAFSRIEVVELVEFLEKRGSVYTQVVDGETHVFLQDCFFLRIL